MEQLSQCYMRLDREPQRVKELLDRASRLEHRPEWLEWLTVQAAAAEAGPSAVPAASSQPSQTVGTVLR
jgi:hypothetical protein